MAYDELEEIRRRKLEELKRKLLERQEEEQAKAEMLKRQIEEMELIVKKYLDGKARERLAMLKLAHPDRYLQVLTILYQNIAAGRLNRKLSDGELKKILKRLIELTRRETKIRFIRE